MTSLSEADQLNIEQIIIIYENGPYLDSDYGLVSEIPLIGHDVSQNVWNIVRQNLGLRVGKNLLPGNTAEFFSKALAEMFEIASAGSELIASDGNADLEALSLVQCIDAFENRHGHELLQRGTIRDSYFVAALIDLVDFITSWRESVIDSSRVDLVAAQSSSRGMLIDALGCLLSAEMCVEKGMGSLIIDVADRGAANLRLAHEKEMRPFVHGRKKAAARRNETATSKWEKLEREAYKLYQENPSWNKTHIVKVVLDRYAKEHDLARNAVDEIYNPRTFGNRLKF